MEDLDEQTIAELKAKAIERSADEDGESEIITNEIDEELKDYGGDKEPPTIIEEPSPQEVKKPKRQRSEKQKAAFEKARLKRAENLKIKKQIEAEKKQKQKEEKEQVKLEVKKRLTEKPEDSSASLAPLHNPTRPKDIHRFQGDIYDEQPYQHQRVVNNYYYYGATPSGNMEWQDPRQHLQDYEPEPQPEKPKRGLRQGKKKKIVVKEPEPETASETEESEEEIVYSDPEEPQSYKELQNYQEETERQLPPKQNNGLKFRFA